MEIYQWIILVAAIAYLVYRLMPVKGIGQISSAEAAEKMKDETVQFIDVRTVQEFRSGHIPDTVNIPLNELARRSRDLDKNREIMLLCASGIRSGQAAKILKKQGFKTVYNIKGGLSAWK